jgi:tripartite-type tricarboxylate transporter receptor subunit TctC
MINTARRIGAAGAIILAATCGAMAQGGDLFFKGRTVSIYIGFGGGGSYDFYGHLIARHMSKHIPGNPTVVAQSMPGAGSFKLANFLSSLAPKDGTAMGIVSQAIALEEALGSQGVQYKAAEFNWIGRATSVIEILMTLDRPGQPARVTTVQEAMQREVLTGGTGPGSPSEGYPKLLNAAASTKFRIIAGYPASAEVLLAMEKGEVDSAFTSWGSLSAYHQDWLDAKRVHMLVQGTVKRSKELPDVTAVGELGNSAEDRTMLQLYASTAEIGRSFIAPPGIPAERVATLRTAFDATMKDPDFIAEVKRAKAEFDPLPGAELQTMITDVAKTPPAIIARMKSLLQTVAK